MPALRAFVLGVGHMRRKGMAVGEKSPSAGSNCSLRSSSSTSPNGSALRAKRDLTPEEIGRNLWSRRARRRRSDLATSSRSPSDLDRRGVIGRFSTFLEHTKPVAEHERVSSFNGLFHWAVPAGREIEAGCEIGRFEILTHCYWRDAGPELNNVNIMAVAHGETKER